jgi:hypothetical protein
MGLKPNHLMEMMHHVNGNIPDELYTRKNPEPELK